MTKTYSEQRQDAYFKAAVTLYKLVVEIADENVDNAPEGEPSDATLVWAASLIESTFKKAYDLDTLGQEETVATPRAAKHVARHRWAAHARTAEGRRQKAAILAQVG